MSECFVFAGMLAFHQTSGLNTYKKFFFVCYVMYSYKNKLGSSNNLKP